MLNIQTLEALIQTSMAEARVPGLSLAIVHNLEVIYVRGFGVTSVEAGAPAITPETIFRIGSTSKPLTATLVMRLVEQGKLELDTPVSEILPTLRFKEPGAVDQITLRKLLSHTAGLFEYEHYRGSHELADFGPLVLRELPKYDFVAPVGKLWSYASPGIDLCGYIAEAVSGKYFADLVEEEVFGPLGMTRSTFKPLVAMTYPLAQAHESDEAGNLYVSHVFSDNVEQYPAGFAMSTVMDMANFAIMHMNAGRLGDTQFLSSESLAEMHTPIAKLPSVHGHGYGLGLAVQDYDGVKRVGHGGRIDSYASKFEMVPEHGTAVLMLCNYAPQWGPYEEHITRHIFHELLDMPEALPVPQAAEPDKTHWPQLVGTYVSANVGMATVTVGDEQLVVDHMGTKLALSAVAGTDLFFAPVSAPNAVLSAPVTVSFIGEADAPAEYMTVAGLMGLSSPLRRLDFDPAFAVDQANLARYAGHYSNDFLYMSIKAKEGQLYVYNAKLGYGPPLRGELPLQAVDQARFLGMFGLLTFEVTADAGDPVLWLGKTTRFTLRARLGEG